MKVVTPPSYTGNAYKVREGALDEGGGGPIMSHNAVHLSHVLHAII